MARINNNSDYQSLNIQKKNKFVHPVYLSEKQICDQLEQFFLKDNNIFGYTIYRELQVGHIRPDFIILSKKYAIVEIIEVKITANIDAVRQLCFYKRIIEEYIRINYSQSSEKFRIPKICASIYAKNFDIEIIDLCVESGINLKKLKTDKNQKIEIDCLDYELFPTIPDDSNFNKIIINHFGGNHV